MFSNRNISIRPINRRKSSVKTKPKKYSIVLDLDNTLISAVTQQDIEQHWEKLPEIHRKNMVMKIPRTSILDNEYIVFQRPYLQGFLDYLFENFNVSVWSAASKDYVETIVNNVILFDPSRTLDYVLNYNHCILSQQIGSKGFKNLSVLWALSDNDRYFPSNTILIDDLPGVSADNPRHHLLIPRFDILKPGSYKDMHLIHVLDHLQKFT